MEAECGLLFSKDVAISHAVSAVMEMDKCSFHSVESQVMILDNYLSKRLRKSLTAVDAALEGSKLMLTVVGDRRTFDAVDCHLLNSQLYSSYPVNVLLKWGGEDVRSM